MTTLNDIPEDSRVIINAHDTVYIAHDILDIIKEYKEIRSKEKNIKVKLKGFKEAYDLENSAETQNYVTFEHHYDFVKREVVKREKKSEEFPE